jgi:transitional endoplasmic reticulum ATPase
MQNTESSDPLALSPSQRQAYEFLSQWFGRVPVLHLWASSGMGKTTVLKKLKDHLRAHWIDPSVLIQSVSQGHPFAIEEGIIQVLTDAMDSHSVIIIDDFDHFYRHSQACNGYIRSNYCETVLKVLIQKAADRNSQLIIATEGSLPSDISERSWSYSISSFQCEDYQSIVTNMAGQDWSALDFGTVHRFAPNMSCWPLQQISRWLSQNTESSTEKLLDFIQSQGMSSNVDTEEVQDVTLEDLIGADHIKAALEENIILPMENHELAVKYGLTPKRGVILAGPPGTGKTTVGRTLARRLRGKFFLIDGTMISGTDHFYYYGSSQK